MPLRNQGKRLLCSFRLVLKEKAGKEIPVIKNKFLTRDQYQLPQTTWIRQHFRTTKEEVWQIYFRRLHFLESYRICSFISIMKFGSFSNLFERIPNLSDLHLRCRRIILPIQTKETDFYEL